MCALVSAAGRTECLYCRNNFETLHRYVRHRIERVEFFSNRRNKHHREMQVLQTHAENLESQVYERDTDEQSRIAPALEALERARVENARLADSLEEAISSNAHLKQEVDRLKVLLSLVWAITCYCLTLLQGHEWCPRPTQCK